MSLWSAKRGFIPSQGVAKAEYPTCPITYTRDTWVKLLNAPSPYAADEAKLLCQATDYTWVVWVPDYGQLVLNRSQFYC